MSDTQIQFTEISNWVLRVNIQKRAIRRVENGKEKYDPIAPFDLGITLNARFLAVAALIEYGRPTWVHGGFLNQQYPFPLNTNISPFQTAITQSQFLLINTVKIVQFPRLSGSNYRLWYTPRKWFRDIRIKVWQYRGEEYNFVDSTLYDIQQKINQLL